MKKKVSQFKEQVSSLYPNVTEDAAFYKSICRYLFMNPNTEPLNALIIIETIPSALKVQQSDAWNLEYDETVYIKKGQSGIPQLLSEEKVSDDGSEIYFIETLQYQFDVSQMDLKKPPHFNSELWMLLNSNPEMLEELELGQDTIEKYIRDHAKELTSFKNLTSEAQNYITSGVLSALSGIFQNKIHIPGYEGTESGEEILTAVHEIFHDITRWIERDYEKLEQSRRDLERRELLHQNSKRDLTTRVVKAKEIFKEIKMIKEEQGHGN